jgi:hypothetical protein
MSFGIGLGGFVQGVNVGMAAREQFDQRQQRRQNKAALTAIDTEARQRYDAQVQSGTASPDDFDRFWMEYALPRREAELLRQGDIAGARALDEWGTSRAARKGGRLFASALLKAQTGDPTGALEYAIEAARVQGYIEHDYEMVGMEEQRTESGDLVGYRLQVKRGDETMEQDIAVGDVPQIVATFASPDQAWASQQERRQEQRDREQEDADDRTKRERDIEDHRRKNEIDAEFDDPEYADDYRKAFDQRLQNDLEFADLSREEQDKIIRDDLAAQEKYSNDRRGTPRQPAPAGTTGAPSAANGNTPAAGVTGVGAAAPSSGPNGITPQQRGQKILIDTQTGQPVRAPEAATQPARPQVSAPPQPAPTAGITGPASAPPQPASVSERDARVVQAARDAVASGADINEVRRRMVGEGVDPALLGR